MTQYSSTQTTLFINKQLDILHGLHLGDPSFLSGPYMMQVRRGDARVALDSVERIARALFVCPHFLGQMVLRDHWPEVMSSLGALGLLAETLNEPSEDQVEVSTMSSAEEPPAYADNEAQTSKEGSSTFVDMNFKVSADFHRRFKREAFDRGISMKALLEQGFRRSLGANATPVDLALDET